MLSKLTATHRPESEPGLAIFSVSPEARYSTLVLSLLVSLSVELMQSGTVSKHKASAGWHTPSPDSGSFPQKENMTLISYKCDKG